MEMLMKGGHEKDALKEHVLHPVTIHVLYIHHLHLRNRHIGLADLSVKQIFAFVPGMLSYKELTIHEVPPGDTRLSSRWRSCTITAFKV